ncbi:unnamed protein product [Zymoseptoria tritici ST99CH_1E4]|uniref:Uncharacterized protein n=1 Tax=Zymoseptoria tritici ST99CH_1E4 TaxID=1276532 RepID=A0A2H1FWY9_ZYMTR|nr:unnamed protein product [Zymoseptoria tritici ST99CH_1E4]
MACRCIDCCNARQWLNIPQPFPTDQPMLGVQHAMPHPYSAPPPYFPQQWYPAPQFHHMIAYHPEPLYHPPPQYYPPAYWSPLQHHSGRQHHHGPQDHHAPPDHGPQYHPVEQYNAVAQEHLDKRTRPAQHTYRRILPARLLVDDAPAEERLTYATPPTPGVVLGAVDEDGTEKQSTVGAHVDGGEQQTIKAEPNDAEANNDFLAIRKELMDYEEQPAQQTAKRSRAEDGEEMDQRPTKRSACGSGVLTTFAEPR